MILKDLLPSVEFRCRVHLNLFDRRMMIYKQYISYAEDILSENIWLNREVLFMKIDNEKTLYIQVGNEVKE